MKNIHIPFLQSLTHFNRLTINKSLAIIYKNCAKRFHQNVDLRNFLSASVSLFKPIVSVCFIACRNTTKRRPTIIKRNITVSLFPPPPPLSLSLSPSLRAICPMGLFLRSRFDASIIYIFVGTRTVKRISRFRNYAINSP